MKVCLWILNFWLVSFLTVPSGFSQIGIGFFNVENLFDTVDDPNVADEDFTPTGKFQWDERRFAQKCRHIAQVLDTMNVHIVGLCEIENAGALKRLLKEPAIQKQKYQFIHFDAPDERGIDVALLYNKKVFKPLTFKPLRLFLPSGNKTRDILLVVGKMKCGDTLGLLVNHWPSRRNPESERIAAATLARRAIDSLQKTGVRNIILMGDLNDEPTSPSVAKILGAQTALSDVLTPQTLYNVMAPLQAAGEGTHYHRGHPAILDNIVVSGNMVMDKPPAQSMRLVPQATAIVKPHWMISSNGQSALRTFTGNTYTGGFSDHYPVMIRIFCGY